MQRTMHPAPLVSTAICNLWPLGLSRSSANTGENPRQRLTACGGATRDLHKHLPQINLLATVRRHKWSSNSAVGAVLARLCPPMAPGTLAGPADEAVVTKRALRVRRFIPPELPLKHYRSVGTRAIKCNWDQLNRNKHSWKALVMSGLGGCLDGGCLDWHLSRQTGGVGTRRCRQGRRLL